ncbi:MAG: regulatory protein RecX [Candidatus Eremiobacteraeota bacterium]|nr:regulatory protein RecX [Candidatus Eremiobacteraeota bacterium]
MAALRALAQRRLTEAQLWTRLERKGYDAEEIAAAVERCKREGYLDDKLYAELYLVGARKAVGDARMVAALVAKGVAREVALHSLASAPTTEPQRCAAALDALERRRPSLQYPSAARALERLGFPASLIYATLRARLQE